MTEGGVALEFLAPLVDPASRTFAPFLVVAALVALVYHRLRGGEGGLRAALGVSLWRHPSSVLDLQLLVVRRSLFILGLIPTAAGAWGLAVGVTRALDAWLGIPSPPALSSSALTLAYTLVLFVVWDLSRFLVHWAMHAFPALWELHQVHHSAEVLTPLAFHRLHPLESALQALRNIVTTGLLAGVAFWLYRGQATEWTILGVHGVGLAFNALTGNLRHSHVWIRHGDRLERWLLSPAQHQLHHATDPGYHHANYGTWLACWDRLAGTLRLSPDSPPDRFGLIEPNHTPDHLVSALVDPVIAAVRRLGSSVHEPGPRRAAPALSRRRRDHLDGAEEPGVAAVVVEVQHPP